LVPAQAIAKDDKKTVWDFLLSFNDVIKGISDANVVFGFIIIILIILFPTLLVFIFFKKKIANLINDNQANKNEEVVLNCLKIIEEKIDRIYHFVNIQKEVFKNETLTEEQKRREIDQFIKLREEVLESMSGNVE
jgi:DNA integrity scanning protein DisA with diadenylate cyclase activity